MLKMKTSFMMKTHRAEAVLVSVVVVPVIMVFLLVPVFPAQIPVQVPVLPLNLPHYRHHSPVLNHS
jgi:hypothetical protein